MSAVENVMKLLLSDGNTGNTEHALCFIKENTRSHQEKATGNTGNAKTARDNMKAMDAIRAGQAVKVWSGVLVEWLYWVRGEGEREELLAEGCEIPIYTLGELVAVSGFPPQDLRNIHELKQGFDATIGEDFDYEQ